MAGAAVDDNHLVLADVGDAIDDGNDAAGALSLSGVCGTKSSGTSSESLTTLSPLRVSRAESVSSSFAGLPSVQARPVAA